ncbi:hypothetical protein B0A48_02159 [Cryoendolithus antarcticus]|uniref:Condensation domain-containing protein n=1 Tax=Cryoendolithus antarcticus TaxID=1507870 RepID=A0A1V8TMU4_9PEZI|nr:hypothetical protein B0A48_02159 [Cryoendolithus antarcticus]
MTSRIKLSTLDQSAPKEYRRYGFVFLFDEKIATTKVMVDQRLHRLVTQLPVLAGVVEDGTISITLQQITDFSVIHVKDSTLDIKAISRAGMPAHHFASEHLTPLTDSAERNASSVFVVHANWLAGGLLLVMYLHSRVADYLGIGTIVREMSEGLGARTLSLGDLQEEATEATNGRAMLSESNGVTAFFAKAMTERLEQQQHTSIAQQHQAFEAGSVQLDQLTNAMTLSSETADNRTAILGFKLQNITTLTEMIKSRLSRNDKEATITEKDILITLLWRAFARAKYPPHSTYPESAKCSISFEVDVRAVASLNEDYFGNATMTATAFESVLSLAGRYDHFEIEKTAIIVHEAREAAASERIVRSRIALLNDDPTAAETEATADFIVTDFTACQPELEGTECDLGLGLGMPICVRKVGRDRGLKGAVILPESEEHGWWEVQIEVDRAVMEEMLRDVPLRDYLWHVAY